MISKRFLPAGSILAGLLTSHILAFMNVYFSNIRLHQKLTAIENAGYFLVPNRLTMHMLEEFRSAFFGGLFFTLTVGAALTIITLAAFWIWINIFDKNKFFLIPFFLLWTGCLIETNYQGFCPMTSSFFTLVPLMVLISARRWMISEPAKKSRLKVVILLVPIILLSILWSTVSDGNLFINIRDYLLLSNPVGIKINDFYYKYTLYAAEAFKPLSQKTMKTCRLSNFNEESGLRLLEDELLNHDYLILRTDKVDLEIDKRGDELVFQNKGKDILQTSQRQFLSNPASSLMLFSEQTDKNRFFRSFTYFSILIGFPIILYLLMLAVLENILGFIKHPTTALTIASMTCLLIGIALFVPVYGSKAGNLNVSDIAGAMQSDRWQDKMAALREIYNKNLEIMDYQDYMNMKDSPHIPIRYWLVKALGVSKRQETYNDLVSFLDDPHPNVVCQALDAFGQRGDKDALDAIVQRMGGSRHWYVQSYGYRAMRVLGWKQKKSI